MASKGGKRGASPVSPAPSGKVPRTCGPAAECSPIPVGKAAETLKGPTPSSAAGSSVLERPSLPKEKDASACDVETFIKDIRRWCEQQLPAAIKLYPKLAKICEDKEFWQCALSASVCSRRI